jgi:putative NIF3 family GTP cyclohydrolase 1 type 2
MTLAALAQLVSDALPRTASGVRVAGDPERVVRCVAVVGGSGGDWLVNAAAAGADVVVTSDLKHHVTSDFLATDGPAVIDVAHFASEWPWVPVVASRIARDMTLLGHDVDVRVSSLVTDPWTFRV